MEFLSVTLHPKVFIRLNDQDEALSRYRPECITLDVATSAGFAREERLCGLGDGDGVG